MSFPKYSTYKQSGIERFGNLPEHWAIVRLKNVLLQRISDGPHTTPVFEDDGVPFLSVDGIQDGELRFDGCRFISEDAHAEYRRKAAPRRDDLLMGKAASTGKIARVKVDFEFSIWSPLALIRVDQATTWPAFVEYALKCPIAQAQIDDLCTANTQKNISMDDIPRLMLARPPLSEQITIATFLDRETSKIDALVEEQKRLIELLKEKRQAVISQAVTKGLNPNVPMKDSGVEWLGEVPAHWTVAALQVISERIQTGPFGSQLHSEDYVEGATPVINPSNIGSDSVNPDWSCTVDDSMVEQLSHHRFEAGDIAVARRGEMGRCAVIQGQEVGWLCGTGTLGVRLSPRALPTFVAHYLKTSRVRGQLELESVGSTMDNLNARILGRLRVPFPSASEQVDIVSRVSFETTKVDSLVLDAQRAIHLLSERRSALISAAVTGKIDVRGLVQRPEAVAA